MARRAGALITAFAPRRLFGGEATVPHGARRLRGRQRQRQQQSCRGANSHAPDAIGQTNFPTGFVFSTLSHLPALPAFPAPPALPGPCYRGRLNAMSSVDGPAPTPTTTYC